VETINLGKSGVPEVHKFTIKTYSPQKRKKCIIKPQRNKTQIILAEKVTSEVSLNQEKGNLGISSSGQ
jgi:hypothetical protein